MATVYAISIDCEKNLDFATDGPETFGYDFYFKLDDDAEAAETRDALVRMIVGEYGQPVIGSTVAIVDNSVNCTLWDFEKARKTIENGYR